MTPLKPPVPPDTDVRRFPAMMLEIERLQDSALIDTTTGDEFKAAVLLWCKAWRQVPAGSLPNDDRQLSRWSGYGERWGEIRTGALHGFVLCDDGRFYHPVICEKALEALAWSAERSTRARAAAAKRWEHKQKLNNARAMPEQCPSNANAMQCYAEQEREREIEGNIVVTKVTTPSSRALRTKELNQDFAEVWLLYPRHVGKGAAQKAYHKARQSTDAETLREAVEQFALARAGEDQQFTPHMSTWLNAQRWLDDDKGGVIDHGYPGPIGPKPTIEEVFGQRP